MDSPSKWSSVSPSSAYGKQAPTYFFENEDIVDYHRVIKEIPLEKASSIFAEITDRKKHLIQQLGIHGCTAAATAMLLIDSEEEVDIRSFKERKFGTASQMVLDIEKGKKRALLTQIPEKLEGLRTHIDKFGSAILPINDRKIGGHVIVLDNISPDLLLAEIRDPYHGWAITVKASVLWEKISKSSEDILINIA